MPVENGVTRDGSPDTMNVTPIGVGPVWVGVEAPLNCVGRDAPQRKACDDDLPVRPCSIASLVMSDAVAIDSSA